MEFEVLGAYVNSLAAGVPRILGIAARVICPTLPGRLAQQNLLPALVMVHGTLLSFRGSEIHPGFRVPRRGVFSSFAFSRNYQMVPSYTSQGMGERAQG